MAVPPQKSIKGRFVSREDRVDWVFKSSTYVLGEDHGRLTLGPDLSAYLDPDNECSAHGRCPGDRTPPCGCFHANTEIVVCRYRKRDWAEAQDITPLAPFRGLPCTPAQVSAPEGLRTALCACDCGREIDISWPNTKRIYHPDCAARIRRETQRKATAKFRKKAQHGKAA